MKDQPKNPKPENKTSHATLKEKLKKPTQASSPEPAETESSATEALEHPAYQELEAKLTDMEAKANEHWNKLLRAQAELENMMRRTERDVSNAHKYGVEKLILELLPAIDGLEKGLDTPTDDNTVAKNLHAGMELTLSMLLKAMEKFGAEVIHPIGQPFNPKYHEAISMQEDKKAKSNTVLKVLQKGYLLNQRLVRPALVIVAK